MSLPAMSVDRRRTPRTNLTGLAYINFEPNNGGIVLNISDEGLSFHSVAPIERGATLRFSLSARGKRIEAVGVLAWTDEHRKTGGLRFNGLAPDAQRQIQTLIEQSSKPFVPEKDVDVPGGKQGSSAHLSSPVSGVAPAASNAVSHRIRARLRWADFSRGLVAGLLIALLVAMGLSFDAHRQQIGSSLIRLGEHLATTSQSETPPNAASSPKRIAPSSPAAASGPHWMASLATAPKESAEAAPTSSISARNIAPLPLQEDLKTHSRIVSRPPTAPIAAIRLSRANWLPWAHVASSSLLPLSGANASRPASVTSQPTATAPQPTSPESSATASNSSTVIAKAANQPGESAHAEDVVEINSGVPFGRYFEIGKFKDDFAANQTERNLTGLGFRTVIVPKSLLWMKSYQVLVGPYRDEQDAEAVRRSLQVHGYDPRSLAQRSRQLTLRDPRDVLEEETDSLIVTWETYSPQATVRFVTKGETSGTAVGKWIRLPGASPYSAIVYTTGDPGKRTLLSIQFEGMKQAVTLPDSPAHGIVF